MPHFDDNDSMDQMMADSMAQLQAVQEAEQAEQDAPMMADMDQMMADSMAQDSMAQLQAEQEAKKAKEAKEAEQAAQLMADMDQIMADSMITLQDTNGGLSGSASDIVLWGEHTGTVTITDAAGTEILATQLSAVGSQTPGTVTVENAISISGTANEVIDALLTPSSKVYASAATITVTGKANAADITTLLNDVGAINASDVYAITGTAAQINAAIKAVSLALGTTPLDYSTTLNKGSEAATDIITLAADNGQGLIDASDVTAITGTAAQINAAIKAVSSAEGTTLTSYDIILSEGSEAATDIITLAGADGAGSINASGVTHITGTVAQINDAIQAVGTTPTSYNIKLSQGSEAATAITALAAVTGVVAIDALAVTHITGTVAQINEAIQAVGTTPASYPVVPQGYFTYTVPADMFGNISNDLTLKAEGLPPGLKFDVNAIYGTATNADVGTHIVTITATDDRGMSITDQVHLTVVNVNDAPTVALEQTDQAATEDSFFSYTVPTDTFADVDANDSTLTITAEDLPEGLTLTNGVISGTPTNADVGAHAVSIIATDETGTTATDQITITVKNTNDAPTVDLAQTDQAFTEGSYLSYTVPTGTFADVDADSILTLSATALPDGLTFDGIAISGTATNAALGDHTVSIIATDSDNLSVADDIIIKVAAPVQLIQVRNVESMSQLQASLNEGLGVDETSAPGDKVVKFELWLDASQIAQLDSGANAIHDFSFDINWGDNELQALNWTVTGDDDDDPTTADPFVSYNYNNTSNMDIVFNPDHNGVASIAFSSAIAVVDTLTPMFGMTDGIPVDLKIATFYAAPNDASNTINMAIKNMSVGTNLKDNFNLTNYSVEMDAEVVDATIKTDAQNYLSGTSINYLNGIDGPHHLSQVDNGNVNLDELVNFDVVTLSESDAYVSGVQSNDATAILRHMVGLSVLEDGSVNSHAADVNNDGSIQTNDATAILKHIVGLKSIDYFDLIDDSGNRVVEIGGNRTTIADLTIVENGDVNLSGSFNDDYTVEIPYIS